MKQVIFLVAGLVLAFQIFQQVFGATEEELQAAFSQLSDLTNSIVLDINNARSNYSNYFSDNLVLQRLNAKLKLDAKLSEVFEKIAKVTSSGDGLENVNVTVCGAHVLDEIKDYSDRILNSLETCAYETKYGIATSLMNAEWIEVTKLALNYMGCASKSIENCGGDPVCGDGALAAIKAQLVSVPNALNSVAAGMFNTQDGYNADCAEQYVTDFDYYASDMLKFVTSCVNIILKGSLLPVCAAAEQ